MEEMITVETGYGPVTISRWQFDLWQQYGWPTEDVLQRMVKQQAK